MNTKQRLRSVIINFQYIQPAQVNKITFAWLWSLFYHSSTYISEERIPKLRYSQWREKERERLHFQVLLLSAFGYKPNPRWKSLMVAKSFLCYYCLVFCRLHFFVPPLLCFCLCVFSFNFLPRSFFSCLLHRPFFQTHQILVTIVFNMNLYVAWLCIGILGNCLKWFLCI